MCTNKSIHTIYYRVYKMGFRMKSSRLIQIRFPTYISCYKYISSGENNIDLKIKRSSIILIEIFYEKILSFHIGIFPSKQYDYSI